MLTLPERIPALDENKRAVTTTTTTVWHAWVHNPNATVVYLQFWNLLAASVTVGTTEPTWSIPIAAGYVGPVPLGHKMTRALTVAATANADGSGTALTSDIFVHLAYTRR